MSKPKIDGYQILKDNPTLRSAVERMANVTIVFADEPPPTPRKKP